MVDFQIDFDKTALYQHGPLEKASSADTIGKTTSSDHNPENGYAEV